jgi:uncharacterized protein
VAEQDSNHRERRDLSYLAGLVAVVVGLAVALPVSAAIAVNGFKSVKQAHETIVVTGSARYPIVANLTTWSLHTSAQESTPTEAIAALRPKVAKIDAYLVREGLAANAIFKPPIEVDEVSVSVRTGLKKPAFRQVPAWRVSQDYSIQTTDIATLERAAAHVGDLLAGGTDVTVDPIQYLSTRLTGAKFAALRLAVADARERAATIAAGLGAHLGAVQHTELGVYQITPRNSTEVSDYGVDDTSSLLKDVESVVSVTFRVDH